MIHILTLRKPGCNPINFARDFRKHTAPCQNSQIIAFRGTIG
jgi:hypothetical protein